MGAQKFNFPQVPGKWGFSAQNVVFWMKNFRQANIWGGSNALCPPAPLPRLVVKNGLRCNWYCPSDVKALNLEETIAVSGELTNANNYRVVLEEILKLKGNVPRRDIPFNTNSLAPAEQVSLLQYNTIAYDISFYYNRG